MKKQDLETGMLVQGMDKDVYLVVNDTIVGCRGFDTLDNFEDDLTNNLFNSFDIVKASKPLNGCDLMPENWTKRTINKNLLWEREPKKKKKTDRERLIKMFDKVGVEYQDIAVSGYLRLKGGSVLQFNEKGELIEQF